MFRRCAAATTSITMTTRLASAHLTHEMWSHRSQADSAENVKAILLSKQTESLLLDMNWKVRKHCGEHIRKRAAQFEVDVPPEFGAYNVRPRNTIRAKLVPTVTEDTPAHPGAVAALAKLRAS